MWKEFVTEDYGEVEMPNFRHPEEHQLEDHQLDPTVQRQQREEEEVRRSGRQTRAPDRYGATAYDENQPLRGEGDTLDPWWPGLRQHEWNPANTVQPWGQTLIRRGMLSTDV